MIHANYYPLFPDYMKLIMTNNTEISFHIFKVPDTEDETSKPPQSDFQEFSKLLQKGQLVANETKKTHTFVWRGYKACISSQLPKLSSFELERRFKLAMDFINKGTDACQSSQTEVFKVPIQISSSSASGQSSSSSSLVSSQSLQSDLEEPTQIPETQFNLDCKY